MLATLLRFQVSISHSLDVAEISVVEVLKMVRK